MLCFIISSNLYADGLGFNGSITGHSLIKGQTNEPNKGANKNINNPFYSGITHTFFRIKASKKMGTFESGYCGMINPKLFESGYVFENNYLWFDWPPYGEFRAGNSYGLDVEWCAPAQKLVGLDGFIDSFYNNHTGFYHGGSSVGSSTFAPKGTWISTPLVIKEKHQFRAAFSWATNTTYKGFRFKAGDEKLNYKAYLPTNYANIWFTDDIKPDDLSCSNHITLSAQYKGQVGKLDLEFAGSYLFGQSQIKIGQTEIDLRNTHAYILSGLMSYKGLHGALEFIDNGNGKMPLTELAGKALPGASTGTSGKAINAGVKIDIGAKGHLAVGYQLTWSYLTKADLSVRQVAMGTLSYDFSDNMAYFVKGGGIQSVISEETLAKIKVLNTNATGANAGYFIGTGVTVSF